MKWMETIELRSVDRNRETLEMYLRMLICAVKKDLNKSTIKVYTRSGISMDYSVHLYHISDKEVIGESALGIHLTAGLKEFGLVNHSIWVEMEEQ